MAAKRSKRAGRRSDSMRKFIARSKKSLEIERDRIRHYISECEELIEVADRTIEYLDLADQSLSELV